MEKCLQDEETASTMINDAAARVMQKLPARIKRDVTESLSLPFSTLEQDLNWRSMIARCTEDYKVKRKWFMHPNDTCNTEAIGVNNDYE